MQNVVSHLRANGFDIPDFQPDGTIRRFPRNGSKDSGWYIAWQNARLNTGEHYYVVQYGDWRTNESFTYKPDKLTRAENVAIDEQIKERQNRIQKEREKVQLETADTAERRFNSASKVGETPYMARKKIPHLFGAGIYLDRLQIPMRDVPGMIWNLQTIFPDGEKRFMKGGRKKGTFHVIGEPIGETVNVCEGFATGSSLYQATGVTTVVAFDASNLIEVVSELVKAYPKTTVIVCGDDDRKNEENPGRKKAEKAALLSSGIAIFPTFPEGDMTSSDINDLHLLVGLEQVKEQIIGRPAEQKTGFIPLGYDEANYFFYHIPSKDIVKASTFSPMQMYRIAPMDYWAARYPTKKGGVDLHTAAHDLIQQSSEIGPFDSTRIRGTGVWLDRKRVVINTGHSLIVNRKEMALSALDSRHIYIQTRNRMPPIHDRPLTATEGRAILHLCNSFKWKSNTDGYILAGWLTQARIAGALPIRPHIWITGGKGTGKSTLMERLVAPLLGSPKGKMHLIGASTEAGIRQALKASSLPIIFDEIESTTKQSQERIESIIELARIAWSTSQGKILKGSAGGSSVEYQMHFSALFSSIRVKLDNDADRSRFTVLELGEHGDSPEQWSELNAQLLTITEEQGERIFARACSLVPEITESSRILGVHLARAVTQRYGQQIGANLGAAWMLHNDQVITDAQAERLVERFVGDTEDETESELSDEAECLLMLMTRMVSLRNVNGFMNEMSIGDAIKDDYWHAAIRLYGIRVDGERFWVANNHHELAEHYKNTRWKGHWPLALKRLPGAKVEGTSRFGGRELKTTRSVSLPISLIV